MGRAQIGEMGSTGVRAHSSGIGTLVQGVPRQSIPQSEEGFSSHYEALLRASAQGHPHTDVESGPSNTSSESVPRGVHRYSEGAARCVIGSVQPKQQRKVQDVVVDVCEEDSESKNESHGILTSNLTATETSSFATSEDEFVRLLQSGSSSAFERLHRLYSRRLFQQIIAVTRNEEDAEDALQDTFFQAFRAVRSFEGRSRIATWLTRIAINAALMKVRKRRSRSEVPLEWPSESEEDLSILDPRDPSPNPEQIHEERQRRNQLADAIERLEPTLRSAVDLWVSRDCSIAEVANALDVSPSAIKSRMYRARKKLRRSRLRKL